MNPAPSAGLITGPVDQQPSALTTVPQAALHLKLAPVTHLIYHSHSVEKVCWTSAEQDLYVFFCTKHYLFSREEKKSVVRS
jgi:hypothetical protein